MTNDNAKRRLRAFVAAVTNGGDATLSAYDIAHVLDALDAAESRAAAAEAGQRAYGEVLLALSTGGPRPADPNWGPVARALYEASVGGIGTGGTVAAVDRAMDAADDELAKERP